MVDIIYGELVATSEKLEGTGVNFGKIRETESWLRHQVTLHGLLCLSILRWHCKHLGFFVWEAKIPDYDVSLVRACDHIILWWAGHSRNTAGERSHGETGSQEPWRSQLCSLVTTSTWELVGFQQRHLHPPKGDEPPPIFYAPPFRGPTFLRPHLLKAPLFFKAPPSEGPMASITSILDTKYTTGPSRTSRLQPSRLMAPSPSPDMLSLIFKLTVSSSVASASLCKVRLYEVGTTCHFQRRVCSCTVVWL